MEENNSKVEIAPLQLITANVNVPRVLSVLSAESVECVECVDTPLTLCYYLYERSGGCRMKGRLFGGGFLLSTQD